MPKERNKADGYREKTPIKREKSDARIDSSEREVSRPKVKAYEGDTKAMNNLGVCYAYLKDVEDDILSVQCLREFKELAAMFTVV